jgi:6,7-dimethyl-8-ribityllumazine synthase
MRFAIVAGRFNDAVTKPLLEGALDGLRENGLDPADVPVAWVPGAFEIPLVAGECAAGVTRAALDTDVPVIFGVLTTDDLDQAMDRAGGSEGNKGREAAISAIEMVDLLRQLPAPGGAGGS